MILNQLKIDTCFIQMSVNLRERGNEFFLKGQVKKAIECYLSYVKEQHDDNAKAYFNLSLCYSRLGQHDKQVEACNSALQRDSTYTKVYYRLMKAYKQMNNRDYDAFVNAIQYLKYDEKVQPKQKVQILRFIENYKERMRIKIFGSGLKIKREGESFLEFEKLRLQMVGDQNINQLVDKYLSEWIDQWNSGVQSEDAKWQEIAYIIENEDYNHGINLAYFYLNSIKDQSNRKVIIEKIKQIKKAMGKVNPVSVQKEDQNKEDQNHRASSSEQQNLFESESLPVRKQNNPNFRIEQDSYTPTVFPINEEKAVKNVPQKQIKSPTVFNSKKQLLAKKRLEKEQILRLSQPLSVEQIENLLDQYCDKIKSQKTMLPDTFRAIQSMLNCNQTQLTKQKLLIGFKKRTPKLAQIVRCFTKNEKQIIYDLLLRNNIEEFAIDYSPEFNKL